MKISSSVVIFASADALFRAPKGKSREFFSENFENFKQFCLKSPIFQKIMNVFRH